MRYDSLDKWLTWLEQSHPIEIDLGLQRVAAVAEQLALLKPTAKVVTVAGTNGKGSTITALQALLMQPHGAKTSPRVGVYTSPHLLRFNERIAINGVAVDDASLCLAFAQVDHAVQTLQTVSLSYFEFTTLAALQIFVEQQLDYILLEVGLGGRLDAVNIIDADIAVITQIDIDHQAWLGNDREKIGFEKAGILRAGRPAVIADANPPQSVVAHLTSLACQSYWSFSASRAPVDNSCFGFSDCAINGSSTSGCATTDSVVSQSVINESARTRSWSGVNLSAQKVVIESLPEPKLALPSWAAAIQVALLLDALPPRSTLLSLMASVQLAGRLSTAVFQDRTLLLDVAHNRQSIQRLVQHLTEAETKTVVKPRLIAIFAVMADKDIEPMFEQLTPLFKQWYLPALKNCPRAAKPDALMTLLLQHRPQLCQNERLIAKVMPSVKESLVEATHNSTQNDKIVVFGSFFTVGEALAVIGQGAGSSN